MLLQESQPQWQVSHRTGVCALLCPGCHTEPLGSASWLTNRSPILAHLLSPPCPVCSRAAPNPYSNFRDGSSPRARVTVDVFSNGRADSWRKGMVWHKSGPMRRVCRQQHLAVSGPIYGLLDRDCRQSAVACDTWLQLSPAVQPHPAHAAAGWQPAAPLSRESIPVSVPAPALPPCSWSAAAAPRVPRWHQGPGGSREVAVLMGS